MVEVNPYYAHPSSIGEVFDVATFSHRKAMTMAIFGVVLGTALLAVAVHLYNTALLPVPSAEWIAEMNEFIVEAGKTHAWIVNTGIGALISFGFIFLMAALASAVNSVSPNYFFRAGPAGFSVRVPNGVALSKLGFGSRALQLDLRWEEIKKWTLVQEKQFGSH